MTKLLICWLWMFLYINRKSFTQSEKLLNPDFHEMICLIKPQFEAGKDIVDKGNGVIKIKIRCHIDVINNVIDFAKTLNTRFLDLTYSSIKGPSVTSNILFTYQHKALKKDIPVQDIVNNAFENL